MIWFVMGLLVTGPLAFVLVGVPWLVWSLTRPAGGEGGS